MFTKKNLELPRICLISGGVGREIKWCTVRMELNFVICVGTAPKRSPEFDKKCFGEQLVNAGN